MGIHVCMQAMESEHKVVVLEPVIELVLPLQSFWNFMRQNYVLNLLIFNNIYFHIGFYMYMYMQTSIFD